MTSALIGFSGFVGGTLASAEHFDLLVNRANIQSLRGLRVDRLVCAGLPAAKWIANERPDEDAENVRNLEATLRSVEASTVVVISTIDVYPCTHGADELYDCQLLPNHSYGTHRLEFEHFVRGRFPHASVVRLPALFGAGLKKNVLYDLLHDNRLERINPASRFQWYPLERLSQDLHIVEELGIPLVNLFTEPLETSVLVDRLFPDKSIGQCPDPPASYDLHTRHGAHFGGNGEYVMAGPSLMQSLSKFIHKERESL